MNPLSRFTEVKKIRETYMTLIVCYEDNKQDFIIDLPIGIITKLMEKYLVESKEGDNKNALYLFALTNEYYYKSVIHPGVKKTGKYLTPPLNK